MFIFQFSHDQPIHRCSLHNRLKATEEEASIFWQDLARLVGQSTGVCTNVRETGLQRPDDTHYTSTRQCFERWATDWQSSLHCNSELLSAYLMMYCLTSNFSQASPPHLPQTFPTFNGAVLPILVLIQVSLLRNLYAAPHHSLVTTSILFWSNLTDS